MQTADTVTRRPGHYWVKIGLHWTVAVYGKEGTGKNYWLIFGTNVPFTDSDLDEIGERVLPNGSANMQKNLKIKLQRQSRFLSWGVVIAVLSIIVFIIQILTR